MSYARYRHLAIERAKPAPSQEQLAAVEAQLGAQLPDSYRQFLQVGNGGYVAYAVDVPIGEVGSQALSFCDFYSADEGTFCDGTLVGEIRSGRKYAKIPAGVLPIARDGGGSLLYLDLSEAGKGRVVAFVAGLPEWTGLRTDSRFVQLAESFDEYVGLLRIDSDLLLLELADASELTHVEEAEALLDIGMPEWRADQRLRAAVEEARHRVTTV